MGPGYGLFVVLLECGMILMVPIGGLFFLNGSITMSVFLLFAFVGSMYLTEIRPLQDLSFNFAQVLTGLKKAKDILNSIFSYFKDNSEEKLREKWDNLRKEINL